MQHSGFFRRFAAFIIDEIILLIFTGLLGIGAISALLMILTMLEAPSLFLTITQCLPILVGVSYMIYFHGYRGRTPGKKLMDLKVVSFPEGTPLTMPQTFRRHSIDLFFTTLFMSTLIWIGYFSDFSLEVLQTNSFLVQLIALLVTSSILWTFINSLILLISNNSRAIHDLIGNTIVIRIKE